MDGSSLQQFWNEMQQAVGTNVETLSYSQLTVRAILTYIAGWFLVRLGKSRFHSQWSTQYDLVVGVTLGATLASTLGTEKTTYFETLWAVAILIGLHWLLSLLAYYSPRLDYLMTGQSRKIIEDGKPVEKALRQTHVNANDLCRAIRVLGNEKDIANIEEAFFETSGSISIFKKKKPPQILEVQVQEGVQTVRIEIHQ